MQKVEEEEETTDVSVFFSFTRVVNVTQTIEKQFVLESEYYLFIDFHVLWGVCNVFLAFLLGLMYSTE